MSLSKSADPVGTTLVTGGARGIGAAIARRVVAGGARVWVADVDADAGHALVRALDPEGRGTARFVPVDVSDEDQVAAAVRAADADGAGLTAVFANAGAVGVTGRIADTALSDWQRTLDLLLTGTFLAVKHAVGAMRPRGAGAIVCTGSVASVRGGLGPHAYTAAKHAVKGLVESVASEINRDGLTINAVAPGGTVSSLSAGLMGDPDDLETPYRRLALSSSSGVPTTAEDVAAAACFLASPAATRITGTCVVIDGGDDVLAQKGRSYYT